MSVTYTYVYGCKITIPISNFSGYRNRDNENVGNITDLLKAIPGAFVPSKSLKPQS